MDFHGGRLQRVVPAFPCLPEDALLALVPLARDGAEILPVEVGMAAGAEPPATYQGNTEQGLTQSTSRQKPNPGSRTLLPPLSPLFQGFGTLQDLTHA